MLVECFVFKLSDKRRVTIQEFRGKALVSIREYYKKDGKELPSSKGNSTFFNISQFLLFWMYLVPLMFFLFC